MDVDRHPRVVVDRVPGGEHRPVGRHAPRRHHERQPGIGDEHDARADDVEAESKTQMHERMELPPAVVVGVEKEGFGEEQQDVREERGREDAHQVVRELRIQDDQHERQRRAEGRRQRERHRQELGELVREPVVSQIPGLVADRLDDEGKDGDGEDEGGKEQVQLSDHPDRDAAADDREPAILRLHVGLVLGLFRGRSRRGSRCCHPPVAAPAGAAAPGVCSSVAGKAVLTVPASIASAATRPRRTSRLRFTTWIPFSYRRRARDCKSGVAATGDGGRERTCSTQAGTSSLRATPEALEDSCPDFESATEL